MILLQAGFAAWRQVFSPALRRVLWKSLALTVALLAVLWFILTRLFDALVQDRLGTVDHPVLEGFVFFLAGAGLFVALAYLLPAVSAIVAGYFLDDVAEVVERTDFPGEPMGKPLPIGRALLYGLRFAGLSLLVNLAALILFFVPVVNIGAFFLANAYLLGREYFELAANRFRPMEDASRMRVRNRGMVMAAGAMLAALVLIPILNLLTPLFGVALMVHLHKHLSPMLPGTGIRARRIDAGPPP